MKIKLSSDLCIRLVIGCILVSITLFACKKDDGILKVNQPSDPIISSPDLQYKALIKFLSISLNVEPNEIILNSDSTMFLIRGIEFDRKQMEETYKNANVYHNTYEK